MKTQTGNKLIAEFMGYRKDELDNYLIPIMLPQFKGSNHREWATKREIESIEYWEINEASLEYNYSWDWLMPVIIKIHDDASTYKDGTSYEYRSNADHVVSFLRVLDREKVWKEVVKFIQWYNQDKTK